MSNTLQFAGLFGRVLIAAIFLLAGVGKLMDWDGTAQYMALHRMKAVPTFETLAVLFELGAGTCLLFGYRTREAAVALIIFLVPVTVIFHNFWSVGGPEQMDQMQHFLKNVAILGTLITLTVTGAIGWAVDNTRLRAGAADTGWPGGRL